MAGVKLTKHDTFMARSEFMQLVYACCSPARPGQTDQADLLVPPPTIWKPEPLWTGKQVLTPSSLLLVVMLVLATRELPVHPLHCAAALMTQAQGYRCFTSYSALAARARENSSWDELFT